VREEARFLSRAVTSGWKLDTKGAGMAIRVSGCSMRTARLPRDPLVSLCMDPSPPRSRGTQVLR